MSMHSKGTSADAIDEFFGAPQKYNLDCTGAAVLVLYKGALDALVELDPENGRAKFNKLYPRIEMFGDASTRPEIEMVRKDEDGSVGDYIRADNPDYDKPGWRGESMVQLDPSPPQASRDTVVFGHPMGTTTVGRVLDHLSSKRLGLKPGEIDTRRSPSLEPDRLRLDPYNLAETARRDLDWAKPSQSRGRVR